MTQQPTDPNEPPALEGSPAPGAAAPLASSPDKSIAIEEKGEGLIEASRDGKVLARAQHAPKAGGWVLTLRNGREVGCVAEWSYARIRLRWAARYYEGLLARGIA